MSEEKKDIVITIDDLMNEFRDLKNKLSNIYDSLIILNKKIDNITLNQQNPIVIKQEPQINNSGQPIINQPTITSIDQKPSLSAHSAEEASKIIKQKQKELLIKKNPALREPQWTGEVIGEATDLKKSLN